MWPPLFSVSSSSLKTTSGQISSAEQNQLITSQTSLFSSSKTPHWSQVIILTQSSLHFNHLQDLHILLHFIHSSQRSTKSVLKKSQSHFSIKSQFSPEMTLLKSQQNFQSHLKSNFLFTSISNICFKKFLRWLVSSSQ